MRLLLDENLSPAQSAVLREQGHDAVGVVEAGLLGQPDERVRDFAIAENRVLITLDSDFADLRRFPTAGTPGVIRLKIHPPTEQGIRELIERVLARLEGVRLDGRLAVAQREMIRIRS